MNATLTLSIRPIQPTQTDYQHLTDLWNACNPDYPETVEETKFQLENIPPTRTTLIYFAELENKVVGRSSSACRHTVQTPHAFWLSVRVHPEYRNRGVGKRLFEHHMNMLEPHKPTKLKCSVDEDKPYALRFAERRGFVEEVRHWESRLAVQEFNETPYARLEAKINALNIKLFPLTELMDATPNYKDRLFELDWECTLDEPMPDPPIKPEKEPWLKGHLENPNFTPEAYLIAVHGDAWIGMNELSRSQEGDGLLYNGFTALRRGYRNKGIATALKVKNILWAKKKGFKEIRTWNNSVNEPMLAVNTKLGFKKQPADIGMKKEIRYQS